MKPSTRQHGDRESDSILALDWKALGRLVRTRTRDAILKQAAAVESEAAEEDGTAQDAPAEVVA